MVTRRMLGLGLCLGWLAGNGAGFAPSPSWRVTGSAVLLRSSEGDDLYRVRSVLLADELRKVRAQLADAQPQVARAQNATAAEEENAVARNRVVLLVEELQQLRSEHTAVLDQLNELKSAENDWRAQVGALAEQAAEWAEFNVTREAELQARLNEVEAAAASAVQADLERASQELHETTDLLDQAQEQTSLALAEAAEWKRKAESLAQQYDTQANRAVLLTAETRRLREDADRREAELERQFKAREQAEAQVERMRGQLQAQEASFRVELSSVVATLGSQLNSAPVNVTASVNALRSEVGRLEAQLNALGIEFQQLRQGQANLAAKVETTSDRRVPLPVTRLSQTSSLPTPAQPHTASTAQAETPTPTPPREVSPPPPLLPEAQSALQTAKPLASGAWRFVRRQASRVRTRWSNARRTKSPSGRRERPLLLEGSPVVMLPESPSQARTSKFEQAPGDMASRGGAPPAHSD